MPRLLLAVLVALAAPSRLYAQCNDVDKKQLEEFDRAWSDATNSGDRARLESIFASDYAGATFSGVVGRAAAIDNAVRQAERNRANPQAVPRTAYDNYIITCTPNSATVTHRNTITSTANGREQTTYSRSVHVLEKRGGRWQVVGNAGHGLDDTAVLLYMERDWADADVRKDGGWYARNLADDATFVGAGTGVMQTKAEVIASLQTDKSVTDSIELSELNVRIDGNMAIVTGVSRVKGRNEQGAPFERRVRWTDTFVKREGRWL
ncbi:MAG: nuclear transport factor 2 family protein, partial [Longimicrobiales bacterium]